MRDVQMDAPVARCENPKCRGEIYHEETTYKWEGKELCSDCFKDLLESLMGKDLPGLALLLGVDMVRYV